MDQIISQVKQSNPEASIEQIRSNYQPLLDQVEVAREALFKKDALQRFLFILLAALTVLLVLRKVINKQIGVAAIVILVLFDMWPVAKRYLGQDKFVAKGQSQNPYALSKADEIILTDKDPNYRVLNLTVSPFQDGSTSYWHKSIGGYHAAKMRRYQELIDFQIDKDIKTLYQGFRSGAITDSALSATFAQTRILNMLNTKYIIGNGEAPPLVNNQAYGNAWFVKDIKTVQSADEEIKALDNTDPKTTAVVDKRFEEQYKGFKFSADTTASIKLNAYASNHLVYESKAASPQLAVFSEIYYDKGWKAYIDGAEAPHFRADYVLRAMQVPVGVHKIEFKFEPASYITGRKISLFGSILLLIVFIAGVTLNFWKRKAIAV